MLSDKQREVLLRPINPKRVLEAQGQSHLPAFDVEAHLNRIFGFEGWDREVLRLWLIDETGEERESGGKKRMGWTVTYGCHLRLTVRDPEGHTVKVTEGVATGSAKNLPSKADAHDFAMKNADSYALKRAAKAWGDQFGLSLYNRGMLSPLVKTVVAYDDSAPDDEVPTPLSMGNDEREDPEGLVPEAATAGNNPPPERSGRPSGMAPGQEPMSEAQRRRIFAAAKNSNLADVRQFAGGILGRPVEHISMLSKAEATTVIGGLEKIKENAS